MQEQRSRTSRVGILVWGESVYFFTMLLCNMHYRLTPPDVTCLYWGVTGSKETAAETLVLCHLDIHITRTSLITPYHVL